MSRADICSSRSGSPARPRPCPHQSGASSGVLALWSHAERHESRPARREFRPRRRRTDPFVSPRGRRTLRIDRAAFSASRAAVARFLRDQRLRHSLGVTSRTSGASVGLTLFSRSRRRWSSLLDRRLKPYLYRPCSLSSISLSNSTMFECVRRPFFIRWWTTPSAPTSQVIGATSPRLGGAFFLARTQAESVESVCACRGVDESLCG
jgi:hypothetical protein